MRFVALRVENDKWSLDIPGQWLIKKETAVVGKQAPDKFGGCRSGFL